MENRAQQLQIRAAAFAAPDPRIAAKGRRLRAWTRFLCVVLFGMCATAVWQERGFAPPVHDAMHAAVGDALIYLEGNETVSTFMTKFQKTYEQMMG